MFQYFNSNDKCTTIIIITIIMNRLIKNNIYRWDAFSYFLITMGATGGLRDMVFDDEFERRCHYGTRTSEDKYTVRAIR